jgi:hypothetical protein
MCGLRVAEFTSRLLKGGHSKALVARRPQGMSVAVKITPSNEAQVDSMDTHTRTHARTHTHTHTRTNKHKQTHTHTHRARQRQRQRDRDRDIDREWE